MNDKPILDSIEPEVVGRLISRRDAIVKSAKGGAAMGMALRLATAPVALATLTRDVFGQAPTSVLEVLEFALLLENLEAEFYKAVLGASSSAAVNAAFAPVRAMFTAQEAATVDQIRRHEVAHVQFLRTQISALGGTPTTYTPASFDFTGGNGSGSGPFAMATQDKLFLLAAAQTFEDTGVRAYKGQAGNLMSNNDVLEAALRIHSVEARHAAKIRKMRAAAGATVDASGTITLAESGISGVPAPGQAVVDMAYAGEANTSHVVFNGTAAATIDADNLSGITGGTESVTEAFDEPLTAAEVTAIVAPFVVGSNP
jgi:hypothetical protein